MRWFSGYWRTKLIRKKIVTGKLIALFLAAGMIVGSLSGCASSKKAESDASKEAVTTESADKAEDTKSDAQDENASKDNSEDASNDDAIKASEKAAEEALKASEAEAKDDAAKAADDKSDEKEDETKAKASNSDEKDASAEPVVEEPSGLPDLQYTNELVSTIYGDDAKMQIVVLGDSQFGNYKGYDGLGFLMSNYCHANVYNLAIGGLTAAYNPNDSKCGIDMMQAVVGNKDINEILGDTEADTYVKRVFEACNFDKTDVFIVEFGVNDFINNIPMANAAFGHDYRTAMYYIGNMLLSKYPNAHIVFCGPSYTQFWGKDRTYLGDINTYHNDYGALIDYYETVSNMVSTNLNNDRTSFYDSYFFAGIDSTNAYEYMETDGIHMNQTGREMYGKVLARYVIRAMGYSIEEGGDPTQIEWWTTK